MLLLFVKFFVFLSYFLAFALVFPFNFIFIILQKKLRGHSIGKKGFFQKK